MKKILILTLGTGSIYSRDEEKLKKEEKQNLLRKMIGEKKFPYRVADYYFDDPNEIQQSSFVAEPLLKKFEPDIVVIIGTVKSSWTSLYSKFGNLDSEDSFEVLNRIYDIEYNYGKDTNKEELSKLQKEINGYFKGIFGKDKELKIILTRYGLNREELVENYDILAGIKNLLLEEEEYEVAFDITHSFRSMPIYNLVILNYLIHVNQYKLTIKHVYYGNVETSRENNGMAPIVDLFDLINVMDLTNGVSEFENTGNAITMLSLLSEEESLNNALAKFDWATQINSYDAIRQSLKELLIEVEKKNVCSENKFADIRKMVRTIIKNKFFGGIEVTSDTLERMSREELQFMICNWYYKQNRYGQAIVTVMEVLRSMLVPLYLELNQKAITDENMEKEKYRREAVVRLHLLELVQNKPQDEFYSFLLELEKCRQCACPIRNQFAHNLNGEITMKCGDCSVTEQDFCGKYIVDRFMKKIDTLAVYLKEQREEIKKAYFTPIRQLKESTVCKNERNENVRLVITNDTIKDYKFLAKTNKTSYDLYLLPNDICEVLKQNSKSKSGKNNKIIANALFLKFYISEHFDEYANIIIDEEIGIKQVLHYACILQEQGIKNLWVLNSKNLIDKVPNVAFNMEYEEHDLGEQMIRLLELRPKSVRVN